MPGYTQYNDAGRAIPRANFIYGPTVRGFDNTFWKATAGTPTVASNKIRLNADSMSSYTQYKRGEYTFRVNVPTTPSAGEDKIWGLRNPDAPTIGSAYFQITGAVFQVVSYDDVGNAETTAVTWAGGTWDANDIDYDIIWDNTTITFAVNGAVVATHTTRIGTVAQSLTVNNADADNTDVDYLIIKSGLAI